MIRLLLILLLAALLVLVVVQIVRSARGARIDWTGIAFAIGFVVTAFWLRDVTGTG